MVKNSKKEYEAVISLKTHVRLSTKTKMFCGCSMADAGRNLNTCPVCLGHPGTLPVMNRKALELSLKTALALNCEINRYTSFQRKNYFYPDLSKNYQISQFGQPLGKNGYIEIKKDNKSRRIGIGMVRMEEDHGSIIQLQKDNDDKRAKIVDFNRSGAPLLEIITKPEIKNAQEANDFMESLRDIVLLLQASDCDFNKRSLSCDANVFIKEVGREGFETESEIKKLDSFDFIKKGLDFEIKRQIGIFRSGEKRMHEKRVYDAESGKTIPLSIQEESWDLRYFSEPDLEPLYIDDALIEKIKRQIPRFS
jgi:aspartyl-tRNA(Asn)/glutamyl-tRNA(Gln) amidotransferase subunit B